MKSNEIIIGDSEINRRYDILSNIVYAYINKNVMLNRFYIMLLLNNKFINDRFYNNEKKNEFETYLSDRKLIQIV